MGHERRLFTELTGDLDTVPVAVLQTALAEIASGTASFGPRDEWRAWFHYLLPRLVRRANQRHVHSLSETLVTAFMALHPHGVIDPPYPERRADALRSLGRSLMQPDGWNVGRIVVGELLHRHVWPSGRWGWNDASGDFAAGMAFHLKYLTADEVPAWLASALAIDCPYWRAQLLVWFIGARDILDGRLTDPSGLQDAPGPGISWDWSHCLNAARLAPGDPVPFFPRENREAALDGLTQAMSETLLREWLRGIATVPALQAELGDLPDRFRALYL